MVSSAIGHEGVVLASSFRRPLFLRPQRCSMKQQGLKMTRSGGQKDNWSDPSFEYSEEASEEEYDTKDVVAGIDKRGRDVSDQMVVGAGALRGEQELYSMRDLQGMKVPRLRSMCEARGLKKIGTKPELINRLLASTMNAGDASAQHAAINKSPTPSRLMPTISDQNSPLISHASSGSSPVSTHAVGRNLARGIVDVGELDEDGTESGSVSETSLDSDEASSAAMQRPPTPPTTSHPAMVQSTQLEASPDFRPSGKDLEKIINAPKIVRRAGRAVTLKSSKINKYQPDRLTKGSKFSGLKPPTDNAEILGEAIEVDDTDSVVEAAKAATLNGIPREFLPPSLRSFDPSFQHKRRGPGRPRMDDSDSEEGPNASEWEMVKAGGGMGSSPQASPFDAMIAADEEEERLNGVKKKGAKKKKAAVASQDLDEDDDDGVHEDDMVYFAKPAKQMAKSPVLAIDDDDDEEVEVDDEDDELPALEEEADTTFQADELVFVDGVDDEEDAEDDKIAAFLKGEGDDEDASELEEAPAAPPPRAAKRRGRPAKNRN
eukprot:CAMPEP_0181301200 /NCGR_PEP_ID=MMETSP1101-20121128/7295_1 /TAXON_ID=46948 /ORGANISM="Rhodomonas abbreviata, Strain Caron Lab Isolate" /LENGTH=545 /DNA_ID=CAMNT_0023406485 /DNA_START=613 /DNA_END=2250 /DNA_ORIENTATION=+